MGNARSEMFNKMKKDLGEHNAEIYEAADKASNKLNESRKNRDKAKQKVKDLGKQSRSEAQDNKIKSGELYNNEFIEGSYHPFVLELAKKSNVTALSKNSYRERYANELKEIEDKVKGENPDLSGRELRSVISKAQTAFINDKYAKAGHFVEDEFGRPDIKSPKTIAGYGFSQGTIKNIAKMVKSGNNYIAGVYHTLKSRAEEGKPLGFLDEQFISAVENALGVAEAKEEHASWRDQVKKDRDEWSKANEAKKAAQKEWEKLRKEEIGTGREAKVVVKDGWHFIKVAGEGSPAKYAFRAEKDPDGKTVYKMYSVTSDANTHGGLGSPDEDSTPVFVATKDNQEHALEEAKNWAINNLKQQKGKNTTGARAREAEMEDLVAKANGQPIQMIADNPDLGPLKARKLMQYLMRNDRGIVAGNGIVYADDKMNEYNADTMGVYKDWPKAPEMQSARPAFERELSESEKAAQAQRQEITSAMGKLKAQTLKEKFEKGDKNVQQNEDGSYTQTLTPDNKVQIGKDRFLNLNNHENKKVLEDYKKKGITKLSEIPMSELKTSKGKETPAAMRPENDEINLRRDALAAKRAKEQAEKKMIFSNLGFNPDIFNMSPASVRSGNPIGQHTGRGK